MEEAQRAWARPGRDLVEAAESVRLVDLSDAVKKTIELAFFLALAYIGAEARACEVERVDKQERRRACRATRREVSEEKEPEADLVAPHTCCTPPHMSQAHTWFGVWSSGFRVSPEANMIAPTHVIRRAPLPRRGWGGLGGSQKWGWRRGSFRGKGGIKYGRVGQVGGSWGG